MRSDPAADLSVHSDSSASRAEPPPARRLSRVLGVLVVLLVLGGFVWKALGTRPSSVPLGMAGVGFGMSAERVRETFGAMEDVPPDGPAGVDPGTQLPRLRVRTNVFEEPASCSFWFAVEHTLSKIECVLDPLPDARTQAKQQKRVISLLQSLYGLEQTSGADGRHHVWQNQRAKLSVAVPAEPGSVVIANVSSRHDAAVVEALATQKSTEQRDRIQKEKDELEKRLRELQRLEREREAATDAAQ
jgi:hypothetical protein